VDADDEDAASREAVALEVEAVEFEALEVEALALDERDAQPASVAPTAIIAIRAEILMFIVGSVFMAKYLVSWHVKWFLSKNKVVHRFIPFLSKLRSLVFLSGNVSY